MKIQAFAFKVLTRVFGHFVFLQIISLENFEENHCLVCKCKNIRKINIYIYLFGVLNQPTTSVWKNLQVSKYCFLKVFTINFHFLWKSSWGDSKMLVSRGTRKLDGRELMSRQLVPAHLPTVRRWAGRSVSLPCLLFMEVFPHKVPFSWGAHSFSMVTEHFALTVIAAFRSKHSQWLTEMRGSKKTHRHTHIPVKWWQGKQIVVITLQPGI